MPRLEHSIAYALPLGMNPGTPVSTTALNRTRDLIPSLISRTASSGIVETSKFSWMRLGVLEVVRSCYCFAPWVIAESVANQPVFVSREDCILTRENIVFMDREREG